MPLLAGTSMTKQYTKHTYFRRPAGATEGFEDSRCFPRTSLLNVLIGEGKFSKDLRITKELSVADWQWWTHMDWRSSKNLPPLHCCVSTEPAFPVYLISLSMCVHVRVEVLDISIIGLAIGGLVHMLPPSLSSHTTIPHLCICGWPRLRWALTVSFMWQPIPLSFGGYGYRRSSQSL